MPRRGVAHSPPGSVAWPEGVSLIPADGPALTSAPELCGLGRCCFRSLFSGGSRVGFVPWGSALAHPPRFPVLVLGSASSGWLRPCSPRPGWSLLRSGPRLRGFRSPAAPGSGFVRPWGLAGPCSSAACALLRSSPRSIGLGLRSGCFGCEGPYHRLHCPPMSRLCQGCRRARSAKDARRPQARPGGPGTEFGSPQVVGTGAPQGGRQSARHAPPGGLSTDRLALGRRPMYARSWWLGCATPKAGPPAVPNLGPLSSR